MIYIYIYIYIGLYMYTYSTASFASFRYWILGSSKGTLDS